MPLSLRLLCQLRPPQRIIIALLSLCCALYAGRPLNTDDARVVPQRNCQIDSWFQYNQGLGNEMWLAPACNLFYDTEISLAGDLGRDDKSLQFQIKKLFNNADKDGWGIGVALGNLYSRIVRQSPTDDVFFHIPATIGFFDNTLIMHLNLGYNVERDTGPIWTSNVAAELNVGDFDLVGEVYYVKDTPLVYQVGLVYGLNDNLSFNTFIGNSFKNDALFAGAGLTLVWEVLN